MDDLELWGGHECTVNRIGDRYFDQTVRSAHHDRLSDLDLFADLGVRALRYPCLWERVAPRCGGPEDWSWVDERLMRMRALDVRPILGLTHHGSGPRHTNLLDPGFASGLSDFARAAARRFDWVQEWTPVNEPLTTARFSALYGHWHPHISEEAAFWTALVNQVDAIRGSMAAIRETIPGARLIQTEDFGRTYATSALAHQAEFDNTRRWMSWDLLCGRVTPDHPLWRRLTGFGLQDRLAAIADAPCPPDVMGLNHYLTSDRFLDHRVDRYPPQRHGGNAFMRFADVEAVRVLQPGPAGLEGALLEVWSRYGRPLAVTEVHNGCTREEQMRWIQEAWDAASRLRARGVEVRAVTAWALLGAFDWDTLLTQPTGSYESGVFDLRGGAPRPTALASQLPALARGEAFNHPALAAEGWWRRDVRLEFQPVRREVDDPEPALERRRRVRPSRPILIVGASGTLGKAFARACEWRALDYVLTDRGVLDLGDASSIDRALALHEPWAVINAAGWVRVDDAETAEQACTAANAEGPLRLAKACARAGVPLGCFSSDLVFDGKLGRAYVESDATSPLNAYGRSKATMEKGLLDSGAGVLVLRTAAFFSPFDRQNFAAEIARNLTESQEMAAARDLVVSPTYVPDLVDATLDLLIDAETGLWHLANVGAVSWSDFGRALARALDLDPRLVRPTPHESFTWAAARPRHAPLDSQRGRLLPPLDDAIERYARTLRDSGFRHEALQRPAMARRTG